MAAGRGGAGSASATRRKTASAGARMNYYGEESSMIELSPVRIAIGIGIGIGIVQDDQLGGYAVDHVCRKLLPKSSVAVVHHHHDDRIFATATADATKNGVVVVTGASDVLGDWFYCGCVCAAHLWKGMDRVVLVGLERDDDDDV